MYSSSITRRGGTVDEPDYVYYNASIVNNTTGSTANGQAYIDPQITFSETRDKAIIENASDYYVSLLRFTMEGATKNLPLFIPSIQENTGQINPNLTVYSMAVSYQQSFQLTSGGDPLYTVVATPPPRYINYAPEIINSVLAPLPQPTASYNFKGGYSATVAYQVDNIVSTSAQDPIQLNYPAPYFSVLPQPSWVSGTAYNTNDVVSYNSILYTAQNSITSSVSPPNDPTNWYVGVYGITTANTTVWATATSQLGKPQDISTKYYYVSSYQYFCDLWNETMINVNAFADTAVDLFSGATVSSCAWEDTYLAFYQQYLIVLTTAGKSPTDLVFPYPTFGTFCKVPGAVGTVPPILIFDTATSKFILQADSDAFGQRLLPFTPVSFTGGSGGKAGIPTPPIARLFFNENMYGLFSNYDAIYYNVPTSDTLSQGLITPFPPINSIPIPYNLPTVYPLTGSPSLKANTTNVIAIPDGYVYEIQFVNKAFNNVIDTRLPPYVGQGGLGYVPAASIYFNVVWWAIDQEMSSVDSLWSPISALVFSTTLLPVRPEATGAPVALGQSNTGFSSATVPSAFQPLLTDFALDISQKGGSANYQQFILYEPRAEFRLSDMGHSKQDIRVIDVKVFWRHRLTNLLYPITMYNLSSVSFKLMFKHKDAPEGKVDYR